MTQIVIWKDNNFTHHFDASTPERWAAASVEILKIRFEAGYFYKPEWPPSKWTLDPEVIKLAEKELPSLDNVDESLRQAAEEYVKKIVKARIHVKSVRKQYEDAIAEYSEVERIVNSNDRSMITVGSGRWERQEPLAWQIIADRSSYEYEHTELADLTVVD